ncbi:MAG: hypothetical protein MJK04_05510 [Psychrosphaera sp.]|nr:hypothetical protein [Psychrosphaera sp.]
MRLVITLFSLLLLSACATTVTSIDQTQHKTLAQGSGFLLLGIQTNRNLKSLHIDGPKDIILSAKDLKAGTQYLMVDLPVGIYTISKIAIGIYSRVYMDDEESWQFEVKPNKISYVGHLEIVKTGYWYIYVESELVNRSAEALSFLHESYPTILSDHAVTYSGPGNDSFFEFLATNGIQ